MSLRDKLRHLEKTMQRQFGYFELNDGSRYYFDPEAASRATFLYFADSMTADYKREPRPEPPELLKAVADATDRGEALALIISGTSHLPIDREALIERGEFKPRSLLVGHEYDEYGVLQPRTRSDGSLISE